MILEPLKYTVTQFLLKHSSEQLQLMASSLEELKQYSLEEINAQQKNSQKTGPEARLASAFKRRFIEFIESLFAPIVQSQPRNFAF